MMIIYLDEEATGPGKRGEVAKIDNGALDEDLARNEFAGLVFGLVPLAITFFNFSRIDDKCGLNLLLVPRLKKASIEMKKEPYQERKGNLPP